MFCCCRVPFGTHWNSLMVICLLRGGSAVPSAKDWGLPKATPLYPELVEVVESTPKSSSWAIQRAVEAFSVNSGALLGLGTGDVLFLPGGLIGEAARKSSGVIVAAPPNSSIIQTDLSFTVAT